MTNGEFVRGVAILARYLDPEGREVAAQHDIVYLGADSLPLTPEDRQALLDLGWFTSEESWACFP